MVTNKLEGSTQVRYWDKLPVEIMDKKARYPINGHIHVHIWSCKGEPRDFSAVFRNVALAEFLFQGHLLERAIQMPWQGADDVDMAMLVEVGQVV